MDTSVTLPRIAAAPAGPVRATPPEGGNRLHETGKPLPAEPPPPPEPVHLEQAIRQIQDYLSEANRQLHFEVDDASGRTIVRVVNPESGEVVRQIPSEEVLQLSAAIRAGGGALLDTFV